MQEKLQSWYSKVIEKWNNLERKQQMRIIGAAVAVVLALGVTVWFAVRPNLVPAYENVDAVFAGEAQGLLDTAGIYNEYRNRSILVNKADQDKAIGIIASQPIKGLEKYSYADVIANTGMGTTQTMQKESLNLALTGRIESILEQFEGVKTAHVSLVTPDDSNFFLVPDQKATASVQIETTKQLTHDNGEAMARIVANGVNKLELEDVTIVDQNFNIIYSGESVAQGGLTQKSEFELQFQSIKEAKLKDALKPLFADIRTVPNFVFNWDQINQKSINYQSPLGTDIATGLIDRETKENQTGTSAAAEAEPGVGTNNLQTPTYPTGNEAGDSVSIKNYDANYLHDIIETEKIGNSGNFLKADSSMGVMAYNYKTYDESALQQYLTQNNLPEETTWKEFKESVQNAKLTVDEDVLNNLKNGIGIDNLTIVAYEIPLFVDTPITPIDIRLIFILVLLFLFILLLIYMLVKSTQLDDITVIEPELSVEDLIVSTQIDEEKQSRIEMLKNIELGEDSEVKRQIEKFVTEKPEAVAGLLRNWLNDEWD